MQIKTVNITLSLIIYVIFLQLNLIIQTCSLLSFFCTSVYIFIFIKSYIDVFAYTALTKKTRMISFLGSSTGSNIGLCEMHK